MRFYIISVNIFKFFIKNNLKIFKFISKKTMYTGTESKLLIKI